MKLVKYCSFVIVCSLLFSFCLSAQSDWKLEKDKNGIKVFTRKLPEASLKDYRVEATFDMSVDKLLKIITDFENYKNWFANTAECYLIEKVSDTELIQYFEAKAPWPVSNRDCVTRFKINKKSNGNIRIDLDLAEGYYKDKKNVVHIPAFEGYWELTKIADNKVKAVQQVASDPGGGIPDWLANAFIVDTPFDSFSNLKKQF